jgi:hypothetical protein
VRVVFLIKISFFLKFQGSSDDKMPKIADFYAFSAQFNIKMYYFISNNNTGQIWTILKAK